MKEHSLTYDFLYTYAWAILSALIVIFILFLYLDSDLYQNKEISYEDCLKAIAIKECESRGLTFNHTSTDFNRKRKFVCNIKDNRSLLDIPFKFYDEELERCELN